jgi:hypothetical protein
MNTVSTKSLGSITFTMSRHISHNSEFPVNSYFRNEMLKAVKRIYVLRKNTQKDLKHRDAPGKMTNPQHIPAKFRAKGITK